MSRRYKRQPTRKPREIEQTDAMRERDELQLTLSLLREHNARLKAELELRWFEVDKLINDKIALATELREARTMVRFLQGEERDLHCGPGTHYGTKIMLPDWRSN